MIPEFIAWDKEKKKWISWTEGYVIAFNGKIYDRGLVTSKRIDLYPYIGRLDKWGKKIYEGSILKAPLCNWIYTVEYDIVSCGFIGRRDMARDEGETENSLMSCFPLKLDNVSECYVVGHIAEEE